MRFTWSTTGSASAGAAISGSSRRYRSSSAKTSACRSAASVTVSRNRQSLTVPTLAQAGSARQALVEPPLDPVGIARRDRTEVRLGVDRGAGDGVVVERGALVGRPPPAFPTNPTLDVLDHEAVRGELAQVVAGGAGRLAEPRGEPGGGGRSVLAQQAEHPYPQRMGDAP